RRRRQPGVPGRESAAGRRVSRNVNTVPPMTLRKKLIAGNWKMNKTSADGVALVRDLVTTIGKQAEVDVVVCPPFTAIEAVGKAIEGSNVKLGAQNMHFEASGAFTGE